MILRNVTVANDREGIEDTIYRFVEGIDKYFVEGIDKYDAELLASAFTEDVIFDLGASTRPLAASSPTAGATSPLTS